ncbi:MAG: hypothetical protein NUV63_10590 [Gallionella sp.]|nr:hypothetical protein [Gallionella sp.]
MKRILTLIFFLALFPGNMALAVTPAVKEFTAGNRIKFSTADHPKSKGINMTLYYPSSWLAREGERPNIVQKFSHQNGQWYESVLIYIKTLPLPVGKVLSESELKEYFTPREMKDSLPEGSVFIAAKPTKIEGLPAGILEFSLRQEKLGLSFDVQYVVYSFIYGNTMVQFVCGVSSAKPTTPAAVANHMEEFKPLFFLMANSIVLQDKWK